MRNYTKAKTKAATTKKLPVAKRVAHRELASYPTAIEVPPLVQARAELKIDIACGKNTKPGYLGVDISPGPNVAHVWNVLRYPWALQSDSVAELYCSHFIEHIPMEYVDSSGKRVDQDHEEARDAMFAFFDECWRVLAPDAWLEIIVPSGKSDRAFQDPTHRRFVVPSTFAYFFEPWRKDNFLDHYKVKCNFACDVRTTCANDYNLMTPEVSQRHFEREWNAAFDYHVRMQKKPLGWRP